MKTSTTILLSLIVPLSAMQAAHADDLDRSERRTISVSGRGEVDAPANLALLHFAVETTAETAAAAVEENARRSAAVASALKEKLSGDDKLRTLHYSLQPRYDYTKQTPSEPKILGYVVSNDVQVETKNVDGTGQLIDAAIAVGANRVSNLTFTLSNRNEILRQALEEAGKEAKAQAEAAARALGVSLGQVLAASTVSPPIFQPYVDKSFGRAAMAQAVSTPVEPGEVSVSTELHVTYEIK